jgi:dienelactone hydrolase
MRLRYLCIILLLLPAGVYADSRSDFLKLIDRPRVDPAPKVEPLPPHESLVEFHFSYASDADNRVPGILVKRAESIGKSAAVVVLHGTGGNKEGQLPLLRDLAAKGFITVAIDARYHGERSKAGKGSEEYQQAILRAFRQQREHPFFFDTVWDVMRLIDYLASRDDVDPKRIGLIGFSKGGIETYLAAAVDERIACAVPCIGVQSFCWALDHDMWRSRISTIQTAFDSAAKESNITAPDSAFVRKFYDRVTPGIYEKFDGPSMLPLIAPRPLLTINGDSDDRTPLPGLKDCTDAAQQAYRAAGAEDHFVIRIQEKTGHKVTPESQQIANEWLVRWLKP